jgi:hypothetical protein
LNDWLNVRLAGPVLTIERSKPGVAVAVGVLVDVAVGAVGVAVFVDVDVGVIVLHPGTVTAFVAVLFTTFGDCTVAEFRIGEATVVQSGFTTTWIVIVAFVLPFAMVPPVHTIEPPGFAPVWTQLAPKLFENVTTDTAVDRVSFIASVVTSDPLVFAKVRV